VLACLNVRSFPCRIIQNTSRESTTKLVRDSIDNVENSPEVRRIVRAEKHHAVRKSAVSSGVVDPKNDKLRT
jgi:hypothetical protein